MLREILKYLKEKEEKRIPYFVPKQWIPEGYDGWVEEINGKYSVRPYEFFSKVIENVLERAREGIDYSLPLSKIEGKENRDWIKKSTMYISLPRMTTSYNHKGFGRFEPVDIFGYKESGTFLKMIAILPYLKRFKVNTLYLLPVSQSSEVFKKGEVGSPYAVKDPLKIDTIYHDPLLEDFEVDDEFKALVEACHILGIRVVLDFIPRTAARDSNLILKHPEWFYWIRIEDLQGYSPPKIPGRGFKIPEKEDIPCIYSLESVKKHLSKFTRSPKEIDPQKWENFVKNVKEDDFLRELVEVFGVITPPGFSDWINDPQPTWDDVTFLRLFLDHPKEASKYVREDQPPYVLFDVIKASKFPGNIPNEELWEYLENVIPHYQGKFGIDGVRLDMGHALPKELERRIIDKARSEDPAFVFIAEELQMENDAKAKESGYDAIIGNSWWALPRIPEQTYTFYQSMAPRLMIPYMAAAETPDTPRITGRKPEVLAKLVPFLCAFSPNGIFVINSGQELGERQPMNLGLDTDINQKLSLDPEDQFFGKLAFFDHYALHWDEAEEDIMKFLEKLSNVREEFLDILIDGEYKPVYLSWQDGKTANASFWKENTGLIVLANLDVRSPRTMDVIVSMTLGKEVVVKECMEWKGENWRKKEHGDDRILVFLEEGGFSLLKVMIEEG